MRPNLTTHDNNDEDGLNAHVGAKDGKIPPRSSTHESPAPSGYSAHRVEWTYQYDGKTCRKPKKSWQMRNWERKMYRFEGATIMLNVHTLEIWVRRPKTKDPVRMLYAAWSKADLTARRFADFAGLSIKEIVVVDKPHPAGLKAAHIVIEDPRLKPHLEPHAAKPESVKTGLVFDESHRGLPELTGEFAAEGAIGFDWLCLVAPRAINNLRAQDELLKMKIDALLDASKIQAEALKLLLEKKGKDTMEG